MSLHIALSRHILIAALACVGTFGATCATAADKKAAKPVRTIKDLESREVQVSPDPPSEALGLSAVSACVRAYRKIIDGPYLDCPLEIGVAVHAGALHMNDSGAILPSGLLDVRSWVPPGVSGIAASAAVLGASAANRRPVEAAPGFFWVEI